LSQENIHVVQVMTSRVRRQIESKGLVGKNGKVGQGFPRNEASLRSRRERCRILACIIRQNNGNGDLILEYI